MVVGDQFIEVVSPVKENTTAGRLLDKRGGDGGYMAIYAVDDLDRRVALLQQHGVRTVWSIDLPDGSIRARHLHPRDTGGAIVSVDEPREWEGWPWGGPTWRPSVAVASSIAGVVIGAEDPSAMRSRWTDLDLTVGASFTQAGPRGEGIDGVDLVASDRSRVGESHDICGVTFRLV